MKSLLFQQFLSSRRGGLLESLASHSDRPIAIQVEQIPSRFHFCTPVIRRPRRRFDGLISRPPHVAVAFLNLSQVTTTPQHPSQPLQPVMLPLNLPSKNIIASALSLLFFTTFCTAIFPSIYIYCFTLLLKLTFSLLCLAVYVTVKSNRYELTLCWAKVEGESYA
jgi:hypothetical protein